MATISLVCSFCYKKFSRNINHINENIKLNQQQYCTVSCIGLSRKNQRLLTCQNPQCNKIFIRRTFSTSFHNYCSRSCAVTINNSKYPKNSGIKKICGSCNKTFVSREKYCSLSCKIKNQTVTKSFILTKIKEFYKEKGRIPLKKEFSYPRAARERFGSWNNAIKAAGFTPNPVMFAKKYLANDGHRCDSLAEKIIDDWLFKSNIEHTRAIHYPENKAFTVDFVVNRYYIEFFGLYGEHIRYDELRKEKLALAEKYKLNLIELYPTHLFPINKLDEVLRSVSKSC